MCVVAALYIAECDEFGDVAACGCDGSGGAEVAIGYGAEVLSCCDG